MGILGNTIVAVANKGISGSFDAIPSTLEAMLYNFVVIPSTILIQTWNVHIILHITDTFCVFVSTALENASHSASRESCLVGFMAFNVFFKLCSLSMMTFEQLFICDLE